MHVVQLGRKNNCGRISLSALVKAKNFSAPKNGSYEVVCTIRVMFLFRLLSRPKPINHNRTAKEKEEKEKGKQKKNEKKITSSLNSGHINEDLSGRVKDNRSNCTCLHRLLNFY